MFNMSTVSYKRWLLWLKISFFSILYHVALLFMLFFVYRDGFFDVELTVSSKGLGGDSPVMFVPIQYEQSISRVQEETKPVVLEVPRTTINKKVPLNFVVKKVQKEPKKIDQKSAQKMQSKNQPNKTLAKQFVQSEQKDVALRVGYRDVEAMRRYNVLQKEHKQQCNMIQNIKKRYFQPKQPPFIRNGTHIKHHYSILFDTT